MASKTYRVGVIGFGLSAKVFHIPLIEVVPEFQLYAVVQRNPKPGDDAQKVHPGIKSYRSTEELVKDSAVDVVVVTTTPESHFSLTKLALESGKHVIVEKPFTPTFKEADELIKIAEQNQRLIAVYQNRRWDADFLTLSDLIGKGSLGRVVEFETHFDRHRPQATTSGWKTGARPGGGAIYDLGTHLIDQAVVIFGMPKRVTGFIGSQSENNTTGYEDSFTVLLHYEVMLATVKAAVVSPEVEQLRYWVRGDKGSYKKFYLDCQEDQLKDGRKPGDIDFGVEPEERRGTLTTIQDGQPFKEACPNVEPPTYTAFYSQFAKALSGEAEVPVRAQDAASVIRLIELARLSSAEGRTIDIYDKK